METVTKRAEMQALTLSGQGAGHWRPGPGHFWEVGEETDPSWLQRKREERNWSQPVGQLFLGFVARDG